MATEPSGVRCKLVAIPETITCVDGGGPCGRLTHRPADDPWMPGDVVAYRCRDCLDRWDMVLAEEDFEDFGRPD